MVSSQYGYASPFTDNFLFPDGVFDPRGYTEKSVSRAIKAKMKEGKPPSRPDTANETSVSEPAPAPALIPPPSSDPAVALANAEGFAALPGAADFDTPILTDDLLAEPVQEGMAPHEAEIAAMLLVTESELATPANEPNNGEIPETGNIVIPVADVNLNIASEASEIILPFAEESNINEPEQDVEMAVAEETPNVVVDTAVVIETEPAAPASPPAEASTATTNMETDAAAPEVPSEQTTNAANEATPATTMQEEASQTAESQEAPAESAPVPPETVNVAATDNAPPEIPPEVPAAVASSSRHRQDSSQARLKLLRDKPEVVSRFLYLIVPILFDVYSASVTLQVRMRCFTGILKATSFVDGIELENIYRVSFLHYVIVTNYSNITL